MARRSGVSSGNPGRGAAPAGLGRADWPGDAPRVRRRRWCPAPGCRRARAGRAAVGDRRPRDRAGRPGVDGGAAGRARPAGTATAARVLAATVWWYSASRCWSRRRWPGWSPACRCRPGWPTLDVASCRAGCRSRRSRRRRVPTRRRELRGLAGRRRRRGRRGRRDAGAAAVGDRHRLARQPAAGAGPGAGRRPAATALAAPLAAAVGPPLPVPRYVDVAGARFTRRASCCLMVPSCRAGRCAPRARAVPPAERAALLERAAAGR